MIADLKALKKADKQTIMNCRDVDLSRLDGISQRNVFSQRCKGAKEKIIKR